jgi:hypothetical protein
MITPDGGGDGYDQYDGGQIPDFSSDSYYKSGACKTRRVLTIFSSLMTPGDFQFHFQKKWKAGLGAETAPLDLQMEDPVAFDAIPQQQVFMCICMRERERDRERKTEREICTHTYPVRWRRGRCLVLGNSSAVFALTHSLSISHTQKAHVHTNVCESYYIYMYILYVYICTYIHIYTHTNLSPVCVCVCVSECVRAPKP